VKLPMTIEITEHTGSEMFVVGAFAPDITLMARLHRGAQVAVGESITFALDPADLHLFDATSGETIFEPTRAPDRASPAKVPSMPNPVETQSRER